MIAYWLPEAIVDLETMGDSIARDNPHRAVTFIQELRDKCMSLAEMHLAFPVVPRHERYGIGHRVYGNYQIFCRVLASDARIDPREG